VRRPLAPLLVLVRSNPDWSRTFSQQPEIWAYLRRCAEEHDVTPHIRFAHELIEAAWDDDLRRWRIQTSKGDLTAQVLVTGMGALSDPSVPPLEGLDTFRGTVFHSAAWDHDHDLSGERVAVIGTGASTIQFLPQIQPQVGRLHLFQRTPPWILPDPDRAVTSLERRLYRRLPAVQRVVRGAIYWGRESFVLGFRNVRAMRLPGRLARAHLHRQVRDPGLRAKLTPDYTIGCKRILISDDYYPALTKPNVELVTAPVRGVRPFSILDADGVEREVDTIIFGTGFHVSDIPITDRLRGRDGRSLAEHWDGSPRAYKGAAVAGFPNLFFLVGPNTGLGHNSIVFMIESQINYVSGALRTMRRRDAAVVDVLPEAEAAYNTELEQMTRGTVWVTGGCESYYIDRNGHNSTIWPTFTWPFRQRTRVFDEGAYALRSAFSSRNGASRETHAMVPGQ
jgi:cation diffusion facilitator CzcD-associated flavoprotein CzcO